MIPSEKTIRGNGRWAKVSHVKKGRYVIGQGFAGNIKATHIHSLSNADDANAWAKAWISDGAACTGAREPEETVEELRSRLREADYILGLFAHKALAWAVRHPQRGRYPTRDAHQITHRLGDFRLAEAYFKKRGL
jgi:hypothetical protein